MHGLVYCISALVLIIAVVLVLRGERGCASCSESYIITDRDDRPEINRKKVEEYEEHTTGSIYGKCSGLFTGYPSYSLHRTR